MELENKKIIERILEMPLVSHLENYAQSGFTEIYMKDLLNNSYKSKCLEEDILEAEKELLEEFPNPVGGRYCLFEFTLDAPWFLGDNKLGEILKRRL
ncbi:hypothetical protein HZC32_02125 [Candidatus Woesearchaeota archaeon]|nr:hypothetical protein [Candidatus Woesearchaeota archaeon]